MSPDELLLVLPRAELAPALAALTDALAGEHALLADVSDMRAAFASKARAPCWKNFARRTWASGPVDGLRRTCAAQAACAIWREPQGYVLIGFRSITDYLRGILTGAAMPGSHLEPR